MSDDNDEHMDVDREIADWKERIASAPTVRVEIQRVFHGKRPTTIDVVDELLDEDDVRERYGGGRFLLRVKRPDKHGRMTYAACATMNIAGSPRNAPSLPWFEDANDARLKSMIQVIVEELLEPLEGRLQALERKGRTTGR